MCWHWFLSIHSVQLMQFLAQQQFFRDHSMFSETTKALHFTQKAGKKNNTCLQYSVSTGNMPIPCQNFGHHSKKLYIYPTN